MRRVLNINKLFILLFICGFGRHAKGQESYTYNSFLNVVKKENPLSKRAGNAVTYGQVQHRAAKGNYDPQLSVGADGKEFNSKHYFSNVNAELKQPLYTSHYLKAGYQYGQGAFVDPEKLTPAMGIPFFGVEASLLQGMTFDKRRAELIKAQHYTDFYDAEQKILINELMYVASNYYAEALYIKKANSLYRYFADLADQRLKGIKDLSQVGERPTIDTIEASIFLQGRQLDSQAADIELSKKLNELLALRNAGDVMAITSLNLTDSLELVYYSTLKGTRLLNTVNTNGNPVIAQYMAKQKILDTERRLKQEMIKPVLNVSYNFLSNSSGIVSPVFNTNNYKWGASFSLPLFLRKPRHEYKMSSLDSRNNELETINKQNQLNYKRNYILQAIEITAGQIANAEKSAAYSRLLVEAERMKFANGESSLFLLNTRENKWLETELKLSEYRLKFIKNYIELTYLAGDLAYEISF